MFALCKAALPHLQPGSSIINVASLDSRNDAKKKVKEFGKNNPMGRAGQPAELAPAFVFLASQDSSYITGEVIGVTGGRPLP